MADEVALNKSAIIERCLKRITEEYEGHEDGFRNVAVHDYQKLSLEIVKSILEKPAGARGPAESACGSETTYTMDPWNHA